jgi:uncharacterized protein YndB with AHSA1/START domain
MSLQGSVERRIPAPPDAVFAAVIEVDRLPEWNERIIGVTRSAELQPGASWVVRMNLPGKKFDSESRVLEFDPPRRFRYSSKPVDDNPSHTVWTWEMEPAGGGSVVRLSWDLQPRTPIRRLFAAPLRSHMIPKEAAASLAALERRLLNANAAH